VEEVKTCSQVLAYLGCTQRHFPESEQVGRKTSGGIMCGKPYEFPPNLPCLATEAVHEGCKWKTVGMAPAFNYKEHV
jgi:hypothetical protein